MPEKWKDKTVSLGNVDKEEFDSELSHVKVSENGIYVEFKDVEDWKRIQREIGDEKILREVDWSEVEEFSRSVDHLYYPHIDIDTEEGEKRLYFLEDEQEKLQSCFNAIEKFWNVYRQRGAKPRNSYSYSEDGEEDRDEEDGDEIEIKGKEKEESEGYEDTKNGENSVEDVVEDFIQD